jgi:hypothetical protein
MPFSSNNQSKGMPGEAGPQEQPDVSI